MDEPAQADLTVFAASGLVAHTTLIGLIALLIRSGHLQQAEVVHMLDSLTLDFEERLNDPTIDSSLRRFSEACQKSAENLRALVQGFGG